MENWLNINQLRAIEWGLNSNEEKLCSYYSKDHKWVTSRITNSDGNFYNISISKLILELPTIGKAKPNFSRALNSLAAKEIFDKYVNPNNKKEVYYRFNPIFLKAWRNNNQKIASNLFDKKLILLNLNECYKNETVEKQSVTEMKQSVTEMKQSVTEMKQSVTEMKQSVTEMEPISININKQSIKQSDKHYNDEMTSSSRSKSLKNTNDDFEKLLNIYPQTVNNTKDKIIEAFAVYKTFSNIERFNALKAAQNYSKTENVKNQKTSKYIQSIHTFLTKSYTKFINGLPENYDFAEKFEAKKNEVGGGETEQTLIIYEQKDINKIKEYTEKFNKIKAKLKIQKIQKIDDNYDYNWVGEFFNEKEIKIIFVKMGGLNNVVSYPSVQLSESLVDLMRVENNE